MIITHIAPFAPNQCGLYEAARDMVKADVLSGNNVYFVDAGTTVNGIRQDSKIGVSDNRGNFNLQTISHELIDDTDIIVMHTGCSDSWIVRNQAPIIWVIHGRPLACFRPEQTKNILSYSLYKNLSNWPRSKRFVYFWPEFTPHWQVMIDESKLCALDYPVIDETRFCNIGDKHKLQNEGRINLLVCDSSREDIDLYEMTLGLIEACKRISGLKIHFYGFDLPLSKGWDVLLSRLKELGGLGDLMGRVTDMEKVYRSVDGLISPNRIITRTIGEALCCGIPVITQNNCKLADYTCDMSDPLDIVEAINLFKIDFDNNRNDKESILNRSKVLNMTTYSEKINKLYTEVLEDR